jgi:nitroimidazol reductase NimA-like FMN-containing flavoprotein (pyridoxamine 5'-phosphate oxidase superfamily)
VLIDEGLELLTEDQCWDLLAAEDLGRVGVSMGGLPAILPVNYVILDREILFRTGPGSKFSAAAANAVLAFEVDHRDRKTHEGWSVLVVGRSETVHDVGIALRVAATGLEPDPEGRRGHLVRIRPEIVTGRRLVHG